MIMSLRIELSKGSKFKLPLQKGEKFTLEGFWESSHDLDLHLLLCVNDGSGPKISSLDQVLSTFNTAIPLADDSSKTRRSGDKRPFKTPEGSLIHSGDARTGIGNTVDETVSIDGSLIPIGVNEIPVFIIIWDEEGKGYRFSGVNQAGIRIKNSLGKVIASYELSDQFGRFNGVQLGSLILSSSGWEYYSAGFGFVGDFNTVLSNFS